MKQVEKQYDASSPHGGLHRWRQVLSDMTENGRLDVFSTQFSRRCGLEVVQPRIGSYDVTPTSVEAGGNVRIDWTADANPPGTVASLEVRRSGSPDPVPDQAIALPGLKGGLDVTIAANAWDLILVVSYELNGRVLSDRAMRTVTGYPDHSVWKIRSSATCLWVDSQLRWGYEASFAATVSPALAVEEIYVNFTGTAGNPSAAGNWTVRRSGVADATYSATNQVHTYPSRPPLRGTWLFFLDTPSCTGPPPLFAADLRLTHQV
jgi:hypothetical protein